MQISQKINKQSEIHFMTSSGWMSWSAWQALFAAGWQMHMLHAPGDEK